MKTLKLFAAVVMLASLAGCISLGSREPGPKARPGASGSSTEKVIVVPEKQY